MQKVLLHSYCQSFLTIDDTRRQQLQTALQKFAKRVILVIIVGDSSVGKTHLMQKYVKGYPPKNPAPTLGVEFGTKTIPVPTGDRIKAQIWDTTGQEKYQSVTLSHYRNAVGAIIVYDITRERSFRNVRNWVQCVRENADPNVEILLLGNKNDLPDRQVSRAEGQQLAQQIGAAFEEISALDSNVNVIFERLCANIAQKRKDMAARSSVNGAQLHAEEPARQGGCNC